MNTQQRELLDLLQDTLVENVVGTAKEIISAKAGETVGCALKKMSIENIRSIIVLDDNENFIGLIEPLDLVSFLVPLHQKFYRHDVVQESMDDLLVEGNLFFEEKLSKVIETRDRASLVVSLDNKLSTVFDEFSKGYYHSAAAVRNQQGKIVNIVSQIDVANFLNQNKPLLRSMMDLPAEQLCLKHQFIKDKEVVTIDQLESLMSAFTRLYQKRLSAVAVIDKDGRIVGNLSATDIRLLSVPHDFVILSNHVKDLLQSNKRIQDITRVITCNGKDTIGDMITRMSDEQIHRLYFVDEQNRPQGLISLTDIMAYFVQRVSLPHRQPLVQQTTSE